MGWNHVTRRDVTKEHRDLTNKMRTSRRTTELRVNQLCGRTPCTVAAVSKTLSSHFDGVCFEHLWTTLRQQLRRIFSKACWIGEVSNWYMTWPAEYCSKGLASMLTSWMGDVINYLGLLQSSYKLSEHIFFPLKKYVVHMWGMDLTHSHIRSMIPRWRLECARRS